MVSVHPQFWHWYLLRVGSESEWYCLSLKQLRWKNFFVNFGEHIKITVYNRMNYLDEQQNAMVPNCLRQQYWHPHRAVSKLQRSLRVLIKGGGKEYRKKMIIRFTEFQCHRQLPKFESLLPFRAALWTGVTFSMSPASTFAPFRIKGSTTFLEPEIIDFIVIN